MNKSLTMYNVQLTHEFSFIRKVTKSFYTIVMTQRG